MFATAWIFFVLINLGLTKTSDNYLAKTLALSDTHIVQSSFQVIQEFSLTL